MLNLIQWGSIAVLVAWMATGAFTEVNHFRVHVGADGLAQMMGAR